MSPRTMTVAEAAERLGMKRQGVHHRILTGAIRVAFHEKTPGRGRTHVIAADVEKLAKERKDES